MARHTSSTLKELQRLSLDKANRKEARQKPPAITAEKPESKAAKCGFALYPPDLARIDAIRDHMQVRGHRISSSQAVRLALRTAALDQAMDKLLAEMRSEDGRGKW
jgi:hypothetical protein